MNRSPEARPSGLFSGSPFGAEQLRIKIENPRTGTSGDFSRVKDISRTQKADYGARTRYLHLGKVALYQMS